MLADILGHTLAPVEVTAASGRGAAMLGARAAGLTIAARTSTPAFVTTPRNDRTELHRERHHAYRRKVLALRSTDNDTVGFAGAALPSAATVGG